VTPQMLTQQRGMNIHILDIKNFVFSFNISLFVRILTSTWVTAFISGSTKHGDDECTPSVDSSIQLRYVSVAHRPVVRTTQVYICVSMLL